jgi:2-C-methyl-D-erythritol 4-phosphate cytidylyltransferase
MPVTASAIIVAAGSGRRLGLSTAKAFVPLGAEPLLFYSMRSLAEVSEVAEVVVALPEGDNYRTQAREIAKRAILIKPLKLARGGVRRQDSVAIGLELTSAESEIVLVHDAARPFATPRLFKLCIAAAAKSGAAIAAISLADTLKQVADGMITATHPRSGLYQAQTPQAFNRGLLIQAHARASIDLSSATDDADLVERIGGKVAVVDGSSRNIKITTKADLELAELIAAAPR